MRNYWFRFTANRKIYLGRQLIQKFFLNCLNACFFGNLTNSGKRESRGKGRRGDGRF